MFSGLFDPPHVKAQKQIAKSAGILRQRAAMNFQIEVGLLLKASAHADALRQAASGGDKDEVCRQIAIANLDVRDFTSGWDMTLPPVFRELEDLTRAAVASKDYRKLAEFEAELREMFEKMTLKARDLLTALNKVIVLAMEAGVVRG